MSLAPALMCVMTLAACAPATSSAEGLLESWEHCDLLIGGGTTFSHFDWTNGLVLEGTLELYDSRWELGAYRFATSQSIPISGVPSDYHAANPYWGFTAMRRWRVLDRRLASSIWDSAPTTGRSSTTWSPRTGISRTCSQRASILAGAAARSSWAFVTGRTHGSERETAVRTSSR